MFKINKIRNKNCICKLCKHEFFAAEPRAKICEECFNKYSICPLCKNKKSFIAKVCKNCYIPKFKGLHRNEIVKIFPDWKNTGFQKGENNLAKRPEIRKKLTEKQKLYYQLGLRKSWFNKPEAQILNLKNMFKLKYKDKYNNLYRSTLESKFSNFLIEHNIKFEYEIPIKMINNKYKIVDFKINDVFVEISGYAYNSWRINFKEKMNFLRQTIKNPIILITYDKYVEIITKDILKHKYDIYAFGLSEINKEFLNTLDFCQKLFDIQTKLECGEILCY